MLSSFIILTRILLVFTSVCHVQCSDVQHQRSKPNYESSADSSSSSDSDSSQASPTKNRAKKLKKSSKKHKKYVLYFIFASFLSNILDYHTMRVTNIIYDISKCAAAVII
jgi:ABC-type bacteriocin/lantibiotic exporter with double-glycine peptidase domain